MKNLKLHPVSVCVIVGVFGCQGLPPGTSKPSTVAALRSPASSPSILPSLTPSALPTSPASATPSPSPTPDSGRPTPSGAPVPPSPTEDATPTPVTEVSPSPQPSLAPSVVVTGTVHDEMGTWVDGATITIESLDTTRAYKAITRSEKGIYRINNAPADVILSITATKPGWTTRTRLRAFKAQGTRENEINFEYAYFISNRPEIVSTTPADGGLKAIGDMAYELTLSEALDEANRKHLEDAIRIMPFNQLARAGGDEPPILLDLGRLDIPIPTGYAIRTGVTFRNDPATVATVTWDSSGTRATLRFNAPLLATEGKEFEEASKYQFCLVQSGDIVAIQDPEGHALGVPSTREGAEKVIRQAFKRAVLAGYNWASTHENVAVFEMTPDSREPTLTDVSITTAANGTRMAFSFDEAMAVYNGTPAGYSAAIIAANTNPTQAQLDGFTFKTDSTLANLESVAMNGTRDDTLGINGRINATTAALTRTEAKREFAFAAGTGVVLEVDPDDVNRVVMHLPTRMLLGTDLKALKLRVSGISDPAGNEMKAQTVMATVATDDTP